MPKAYLYALLLFSALILFAPLRVGDLPGYDDALYSHIAKGIVRTGDWLTLTSNGYPALEHPPLFDWIQATLFRIFGLSDPVAKLPAALAGFGCILLLYWLSRRIIGDDLTALVSVFVLATTLYFIKYAAHAMTDVPFTFFFLAAVCGYVRSDADPRWLLAAGLFTACAQMTRGFAGIALPILFISHALILRRRVPLGYAAAALGIAFLPIGLWYTYWIHRYGAYFFEVHRGWMEREVYGGLSPAWRRYTGLFEYIWMVSKSYWPWLPAMIAGLVVVWRNPKLRLLPLWIASMLLLCAAARSRVLRYMLPAYPAFSILAGIGIRTFLGERRIVQALRVLIPAFGVAAIVVAVKPPRASHAAEIRELVRITDPAVAQNDRIAFYDEGQPRYDEINQLQWYGNHNLIPLLDRASFKQFLAQRPAGVLIIDRAAYSDAIEGRVANQMLVRSGHLVCVRLLGL